MKSASAVSASKKKYVVGIDEVGRGSLAGPLGVGAVLATPSLLRKFSGVKDSKQLSPKRREEWSAKVLKACEDDDSNDIRCAVAYISAGEIDEKGMSAALKKAVADALVLVGAHPSDCKVLLDGSLKAPAEFEQESIIKGDEKKPIIAMASIIAKVARDRLMVELHAECAGYGFDVHKGYGTKKHYDALNLLGISKHHRASFCRNIEIK